MNMQFQSNAQWDLEVYQGSDGKGITTDKHYTHRIASNVCSLLNENGFGGEGKHFPIKTWVSEINHVNERR